MTQAARTGGQVSVSERADKGTSETVYKRTLHFSTTDPHGSRPVEVEMGWDGDDLVVWIKMDCDDVDSEASFGIGGFDLKGVQVKACANFSVTEDQAREWRDALTELIGTPS